MDVYNILSSIVLFILVVESSGNSLSPDSKKIYHDISAGRGLYSKFYKIANLNVTNFREKIFNNSNSNAWLIEFYNSWCGHCHRFSPVWKQFALDIYGWKDVITVGAVDCSNPLNTPLCRDFEIMHYPLVKYFPPLPANDFLGTPVKAGSLDFLVDASLRILKQEAAEGTVSQPALLPFNGRFADLWNGLPSSVEHIVTVIQKNDSTLGEALALDFLKVKNVKVAIVYDSNIDMVNRLGPSKYPSVFLIDRNNNITPIISSDDFRFTVYSDIKSNLAQRNVEIPDLARELVPTDVVIDVQQVMALMEVEEQIKKKLNLNALSDLVFQVDLEGAIRHSLRVEVPAKKTISGEAFDALKLYLRILIDFFPFGRKGLDYLNSVYNKIKDRTEVSGSEFMTMIVASEEEYHPFLSAGSEWIGCRGSQPQFRGYPCSLWTLFHTLTVHADQARERDGKKVLRGMLGYIKHFFGCTDCSNHFQQMAVTFEGNVTSTEDAIVWLWKAHNSVNDRLKADSTEDPMHPKVQFPPPNLCRACHSSNRSWNEQIVLPFLKSMYQNISYFIVDDLPTTSTTEKTIAAKMLKHENIVDDKGFNYSHTESKPILFHFNIFDVSLFVLLYLFSMAIIILVCVKFLFKKTYRKKAYAYDIFQKV